MNDEIWSEGPDREPHNGAQTKDMDHMVHITALAVSRRHTAALGPHVFPLKAAARM